MAALERRVEVEGGGEGSEFHCVATFLPVRSWGYVIPFMKMSGRVEEQLKQTLGLSRYSVRADFLHKRFWTLTVWKDKKFVESFVQVEPHAEAVRKFKDWAGKGAAFVEWNSTNSAIDWDTAMQKLKAPTFYYKA
ncbi:MAG TPA: hypothetical protein VE862_03365 [Candidatus Acidoferrum sp.]|nr:hypothetical protein [Candidatus Acidoferrum sp.]